MVVESRAPRQLGEIEDFDAGLRIASYRAKVWHITSSLDGEHCGIQRTTYSHHLALPG